MNQNDQIVFDRLNQVRARLGSLPMGYIKSLRPALQRLLRDDLPLLLALVDQTLVRDKPVDEAAKEVTKETVRH